MNKIIGLVTGWGSEDWIGPAIEQAIKFCDEVLVGIGSWGTYMDKFEDGTLDVCKKYEKQYPIKLLPYRLQEDLDVCNSVAVSLNYMLSESELFEVGNWIWLLDCDEFYHIGTYELVKEIMRLGVYNRIDFDTRFFLINMRRYLIGNYVRMWRIDEQNMDPRYRFVPTHHWYHTPNPYNIGLEYGMFHYSMLKNPWAMVAKWEREYAGTEQVNKTRWANEIYKHYDLANEDLWNERNLQVSGIAHPWFTDSMKADEHNRLYTYTGINPFAIQGTKLETIDDFRKYYTFCGDYE